MNISFTYTPRRQIILLCAFLLTYRKGSLNSRLNFISTRALFGMPFLFTLKKETVLSLLLALFVNLALSFEFEFSELLLKLFEFFFEISFTELKTSLELFKLME